MATIQEQIATNLVAVDKAKKDIKEALVNKGVDMTDVAFGKYAEKINDIEIPKVYTDDYIVELSYPNTITPIAPPQGYDAVKMVGVEATIAFADAEAKGASNQKSKLTTLLVSENGTYTRADGYSEVTVNVPTSSGGSINAKDYGLKFAYSECVEFPATINFNNCESYDSMFYNCASLRGITTIETWKATNLTYMFYGCTSLVKLPTLELYVAENCRNMFYNCSSLENLRVEGLMRVTNCQGMFRGCASLQNIYGAIDLVNTYDVGNMFYGCYKLQSVLIYQLNESISFSDSPNLSSESIANMISNAGSADITITLHNTAYENAMGGFAVTDALAEKTNVTLASA